MKILVVDRAEDLPAVVALLQQTPGNEIQSAATGDAALELTQGQQLDLLITEVMMEPMNGFTLRNKMENRHPGVKTIFLTGFDLSAYAEHTAGYEVVTKPVSQQKLFPAIARALGFGAAQPPAQPSQTTAPAGELPFPAQPAPHLPAAVPKAVPTTHPPAAPAAMPRPHAVAAVPRATPAAIPRATPATPPRPTPGVSAVPRATPKAVPRAAAPATPIVAPKVTPHPVATTPTATAAIPKVTAPDPLLGKTIGAYRIECRLGAGKWGPVYMGIQTSMNRPVAMEILSSESAGDEEARRNFVATARAKAAVQHPHILSVYEANQADGYHFYTHEYVDGLTLAQLTARGEGLSEPMALQTIKFVSQGLAHLHHHRIPHVIPDDSDIYIGTDGLPYLSNVAQPGQEMPGIQEEIAALGAIIRATLPGGQAQDRGLQAMLMRMGVMTQSGFQSWAALFQAIQAIEPKVIPADAFKLSAQDQAAIQAVEEARKRQKIQVISSIVGLLFLIGSIGLVAWWEYMRPIAHDYGNDMVMIPAGEFIYQNGQKITLPTFYIDRYEVTIAEYKKFLDYLAQHNNTTEFDSQLQPVGLSHIPRDWDIYYGRASSALPMYRTVRGVPITLDCPVFNVSYFDAYAYAKWKGRRLPTQEEWEKAARGPEGYLYPWGSLWDPRKLNAGGDYQADPPPDYKPGVDGFTWWSPVDAFPTDRSPFGVIDMGGNVSEWTNSWDPGKTYVTIRGGNYKSTPEQAMATTIVKAYPQQYAQDLGFRTASDTPPPK
ncbi:MAG: SUMF1/EgtB/PvdO family nonheme iron enzyme [Chthoniobacteraceae bacterium]|jgi:formylglycine-generating enzyme required for sulfatase activity/CheY-like chemotaxis protein